MMQKGVRSPAEYGFAEADEVTAYYEAAVRGSQAAAILFGVRLALTTYEAEHDPLTGLYNRLGFMRTAAREMVLNPGGNYAFLLIDIGNLKAINDKTVGKHDKGDEVIIAIASQLRQRDRVVGRGGAKSDELLVMLNLEDVREENKHLSHEERLEGTIQRMHQMGDAMRDADQELRQVQFFIAVGAHIPTGYEKAAAESPRTLIHLSMGLADMRLYNDKVSERRRLGFEAYRP